MLDLVPLAGARWKMANLQPQFQPVRQALTVEALDANNNVVPDFTGTVHFTSTDHGHVSLPEDYTFNAGDAGMHTFSGVILVTAGDQTVTAGDAVNGVYGTSPTITVTPGTADHIVVTVPATVIAGVAFTASLTIQDAYNNTATSYTGRIHAIANLGEMGNYTFTAADQGQHTFTLRLRRAGPRTATVTDTVNPSITGSANFVVVAGAADHLTLSGPPSVTAGQPFSITVSVRDAFNNAVPGYTGTVHFTSTDAGARMPADYMFTAADAGTHTFDSVILVTAGNRTLQAGDSLRGLNGSIGIVVTPAAANHFVLNASYQVPTGTAFDLTVTALDPFGNTDVNYVGTVHLGSSDAAATLPADYPFTPGEQGIHVFHSLVLRTLGVQTVTANDVANPAISGQASTTAEFSIPTANSNPIGVTAGPNNTLWFTESTANQIGRITLDGTVTEFPIPTPGSTPEGITLGPDGNLWFTESTSNQIGRITPAGVVTEFPIPTLNSQPWRITAGPDGNLWFTELNGNKIGKITPSGMIADYVIRTDFSQPWGITAGPMGDNHLWFTEYAGNKIGEIRTSDGTIVEYPLPTAGSGPLEITVGPDGNLWFTENTANQIGRITTAGAISEFTIPTANSNATVLTPGPDGNVWFAEAASNKIGRITPAGVISEFGVAAGSSARGGVTFGADGSIWFTETPVNLIGRLTPGVLVVPSGVASAIDALAAPSSSGTLAGAPGGSGLLEALPLVSQEPFAVGGSPAVTGGPVGNYRSTVQNFRVSAMPLSAYVARSSFSEAPLVDYGWLNLSGLGGAFDDDVFRTSRRRK
jgi:streptogramin lyase